MDIRDEVPKTLSTEFLKEFLIEDWEIGGLKGNIWDTRLQRFLEEKIC